MEARFRRLVDADLPMLYRWLNEPGIVQWWEGDDVSWEGVVRDYGSGATDPTEHWVASLDGTDVGWIQCYAVVDEPEERGPWWALGIDRDAAGIDYIIGDPALRRRGIGSAMIRAFVGDVVFGLHPAWSQACRAVLGERSVLARPGKGRLSFRRHGRGTRRSLPPYGDRPLLTDLSTAYSPLHRCRRPNHDPGPNRSSSDPERGGRSTSSVPRSP